MIWIIYWLITYSIFAFMWVNMKKISRYLSPREAVSIHFFFIPFGIITFLLAFFLNSNPISSDLPKFLSLSILFGALVSVNMLLWFYLYKTLNLSSFFKLRYWLTIILALIIDFFFYSIFPPFLSIIWSFIFFISWFLLMGNNKDKDTWLTLKHLIAILVVTLFMIANRTILKEITFITTNDFAWIYLTQTIVQFMVFLCGYKYLKKVSKTKEIKTKRGIIRWV